MDYSLGIVAPAERTARSAPGNIEEPLMTGENRNAKAQIRRRWSAAALTTVDASLPDASWRIAEGGLNEQSHYGFRTAFSLGKDRGFLTADGADIADRRAHLSPSAAIRVIRGQNPRTNPFFHRTPCSKGRCGDSK